MPVIASSPLRFGLPAARWPAAPLLTLVTVSAVTDLGAVEPEYVVSGKVAPTSAAGIEHTLERPFYEAIEGFRPLPRLRDRIGEALPWLRDARLALQPRLYNLDRENSLAPDQVAFAAGTAVALRTGAWRDRVRLGVTGYTTQKLHGPPESGRTGLLAPAQAGFGVLGEAWLDVDLAPLASVRLHRQALNLPYLNANDSRMVPNTHEAYLVGRPDQRPVQWFAGHVTRMKQRDSDRFLPLSEVAGFAGSNEGATVGGMRYHLGDDISVSMLDIASWDFMNILYADGSRLFRPLAGVDVLGSLQGTAQTSIGEELGGDFDTWQLGGRVAISYLHGVLSLAASHTGGDAALRSPYGGVPGYLSLMLANFDRAGESAALAAFSLDFGRLGLPGVGFNAKYARGYGDGADPDRDELDLTFDFRPRHPALKGLGLRFRFATLESDDGSARDELRFIANYQVELL